MFRARLRALAALAATLALTAACGTATGDPGGTSAGADRGVVSQPLQFTAQTVDDEPFEGSSLEGKDTVLWFWAHWCTQCRREAPHVAAVSADTADQVTFVGVAGLGEVPAMQAFVADYGVAAFPHLADVDGSIWGRFGIVRQPAYAFIDDSGRVEIVRGELGEEALAAHVADLIAD